MATNLPPLDPTFAPPGMVAQPRHSSEDCKKCAYYNNRYCGFATKDMCIAGNRPDRLPAFFVRETECAATASWPYDDMGTPVITGQPQ